jgi:signal peptidase I
MKKKLLFSVSVIACLLIGAALTLLFTLRLVRVPSGTMLNTIQIGDQVLASRVVSAINRGDIVVYRYPKNPDTLYLKRVVGLPGETIEFRGARVFINGVELEERRVRVEDDNSEDSRMYGPIKREAVTGTLLANLSSFSR